MKLLTTFLGMMLTICTAHAEVIEGTKCEVEQVREVVSSEISTNYERVNFQKVRVEVNTFGLEPKQPVIRAFAYLTAGGLNSPFLAVVLVDKNSCEAVDVFGVPTPSLKWQD